MASERRQLDQGFGEQFSAERSAGFSLENVVRKTVILHCGMHKTGSSAIQDSLSQAPLPSPFQYLSFGHPNGSPAISRAFSSLFKERIARQGGESSPANIARARRTGLNAITQALGAWDRDIGIISAEDISNFRGGDILQLRNFLNEYSDRISVILYARMPGSYLESAFQQVLKVQLPTFDKHPLKLNFRKKFGPFDEIFGKEFVNIKWFSKNSLHNKCIVQDFGKEIGLEVDPGWVVSSNQSLSLEAVKLLYIYRNSFPAQDIQADRPILEYLYGLKSEKFSFHPDLIEQLCEASPSQIDWLERRIGSTRPGDRSVVHPAAVRSLKELMRPSPETLDTLAETVGLSPSGLTSADQIVGALRELGKRAA